MVLHVIGLGLGDHKDVTVKGLEAIKGSAVVFLEMYTSVLGVSQDILEEYYGKKIQVADRECVESAAEQIYERALNEDVAFLVVGDPFCATTHTDLILRAKEYGVKVNVVHNASVMGAVGSCGLQLYNYGQTVSIPLFTDEWRPDSFYDKIKFNKSGGLHTLCLLDIKVKEPDFDAMMRGRKKYLPPRFMTVNEALEQLLEIESTRGEGVYAPETLCVGMARLGQEDQTIISGTMEELLTVDFGAPLHCLVIVGHTHDLENEMLEYFSVNKQKHT